MALNISAIQGTGGSPLAKSLAGFQLGRGIRQDRREDALIEEKATQDRAALEAKQLRQSQIQEAINGIVMDDAATPGDYRNLMIQFPELEENLRKPLESLTEEQREINFREMTDVFSMLETGQTDMAKDFIDRSIEAAQNSGNDRDEARFKAIRQLIETDPERAKEATKLTMAAVDPDRFDEIVSGIDKREVDKQLLPGQLQKQAADLGLTKAQIATATKGVEKMDAEIQKAAVELEALKSGEEEIPIEKKFDFEDKLRDEFVKRGALFEESKVTFDRLEASANEALQAKSDEIKGPADVALVTAFMKMLDPGSVVRETEFANARDTAGLVSVLTNQLQKLRTGGFLTDEQRKSFTGLAKKYLASAESQEQRIIKSLEFPIKNYGLNRENIFGERATIEEEVVVDDGETQTIGRFKVTAK